MMIDPVLESEYDNRRKVPQSGEIIARWASDAAAFRQHWAWQEPDQAYGATAREMMDIFLPGPDRDVPMVLFFHGGYWRALDRRINSHFARGLLAHGVGVAMASYDLCPSVSLATLVAQAQGAAGWLARRQGRRILASGHSAGGHLAAMTALHDGSRVHPVAACVAFSGLFDLVPLVSTSINADLGLDRATAMQLSPMRLPAPDLPFLGVFGAEEGREYARQSNDMARVWGGRSLAVAQANHFTVLDGLTDPTSGPTQAMAAMACELSRA
ncbi:alpha/beta hydrolase [Acetobacter sp. TBRC 12305]|uniref:Alpha/beta hydrolase n=1 Tax=Acetobacter garciniae TaxID=2817435 RepID=A0A939HNQ1_9PROT|nr:alpha/beta hydrolase [Acetobacter garciniae]MBO1325083.1 alpha/beta hydrolase [Acetobacter garciniae]MBX0344946.1 alpha/beta hydrolase [Acetobacter garciniae]